ncbi:MAG TPA: MscL family protein [Candidatus Dormibacteraeota bacterium]|nr:MscL family protein [Candidatus Dormibacteraeota bacterium]
MADKPKHQDSGRMTNLGGTIRFEIPTGGRQHKPQIVVSPDIHPVSGFVDFLREHAVVGLAIGFVIGTQVQSLVKQLVSSFIDPLFKLLLGQALSQRTFTLDWHGRSANFGWGGFVYALLDFLFVLATIYVVVKFLNLDELGKPKRKRRGKLRKKIEQVKEELEEEEDEIIG